MSLAECACEDPGGDPHGCKLLAAAELEPEEIEDVIENVDLCNCDCHWPDEGARLS